MARRFARRRKPRVAWLPTFGGLDSEDTELESDNWAGIRVQLNLLQDDPELDNIVWDAFPLTFDSSESATATQADPSKVTLRDIVQGNEWRLRRIVGKAFVTTAHGVQGATATTGIDVALGFIVSKTRDDGSPETDFNQVNPLAQNSMEDPWIWRRRWLLHPAGGFVNTDNAELALDTRGDMRFWSLPKNNMQYGSVADGPHVDAKTARVIHRSERLYGVLAIRRYYADIGLVPETQLTDSQVNLFLDYRVVGSLRGSSYGNRGNTSR